MIELTSHSVAETLSIGRAIARHASSGDIVCLTGGLGSGKTVLTKGICAGLGVDKDEVISPTFVLLRQYDGRLPLYHFDLYRLRTPEDIVNIGYEEYVYGAGVSVIEWADRMGSLTPKEFLKVDLSVRNRTQRRLAFTAHGSRFRTLLGKIHEDTMR
ncbi:MAG: tRNA (adenosine(37)-N6)-threonylcarbamoyltransferase complex ATPase subunit type 1 TsaE [Candidatus Omnitrophica bacterium]|nr:tRNA (adenosine(37)-N6)-threonylcarbamoyltransferase complex ATPase subunit type 1 TsaE [Candidatus Omnitrophota bacterium]